jgi:regulator of cell morphogenesis and NO signaling
MENKSIMEAKNESQTVGEIVAENYRNAVVFKKYNIDFCCGGGRSLEKSCESKGIDISEIKEELKKVDQLGVDEGQDFESLSLNHLIDHIIEKHHNYVKNSIPVVNEYAQKVKNVHGENKAYVIDIADHFQALSDELTSHMFKEENILFPFIREMEMANEKGESIQPPFGTVQNPISMMMQEHENAGDELKEINQLTESFTPTADACATHRVLYGLLKDFENDLMMHIHLENNILFPKAIAMENNQPKPLMEV